MCYWCGRLTHDDRDCELLIEREGTLCIDQKKFELDLRAPPFILSKKNVLTVLGFYAAKKTSCRDGKNKEVMVQPSHSLLKKPPCQNIQRVQLGVA